MGGITGRFTYISFGNFYAEVEDYDAISDIHDQAHVMFDEQDRQAFNTLLEYPDAVLLELLMGRMAPADRDVARLVRAIRDTAAH